MSNISLANVSSQAKELTNHPQTLTSDDTIILKDILQNIANTATSISEEVGK